MMGIFFSSETIIGSMAAILRMRKETTVNKEEALGEVAATFWIKVTLQSHSGAFASGCSPGERPKGVSSLASHGVSPSRRDISYKIRLGLTLPESNSLPKLGVSELTSKLSTKPIFNWQGNRVKMLTERHSFVPAF